MNARAAKSEELSPAQRAIVILAAQEASLAAVQETMTALGIDMSSPPAMIQAQVDFAHLRRSRKWSEKIIIATRLAIITGGLGFVAKLAWSGLKAKMGGN